MIQSKDKFPELYNSVRKQYKPEEVAKQSIKLFETLKPDFDAQKDKALELGETTMIALKSVDKAVPEGIAFIDKSEFLNPTSTNEWEVFQSQLSALQFARDVGNRLSVIDQAVADIRVKCQADSITECSLVVMPSDVDGVTLLKLERITADSDVFVSANEWKDVITRGAIVDKISYPDLVEIKEVLDRVDVKCDIVNFELYRRIPNAKPSDVEVTKQLTKDFVKAEKKRNKAYNVGQFLLTVLISLTVILGAFTGILFGDTTLSHTFKIIAEVGFLAVTVMAILTKIKLFRKHKQVKKNFDAVRSRLEELAQEFSLDAEAEATKMYFESLEEGIEDYHIAVKEAHTTVYAETVAWYNKIKDRYERVVSESIPDTIKGNIELISRIIKYYESAKCTNFKEALLTAQQEIECEMRGEKPVSPTQKTSDNVKDNYNKIISSIKEQEERNEKAKQEAERAEHEKAKKRGEAMRKILDFGKDTDAVDEATLQEREKSRNDAMRKILSGDTAEPTFDETVKMEREKKKEEALHLLFPDRYKDK